LSERRGSQTGADGCGREAATGSGAALAEPGRRDPRSGRRRTDHRQCAAGGRPRRRSGDRTRHRCVAGRGPQAVRRSRPRYPGGHRALAPGGQANDRRRYLDGPSQDGSVCRRSRSMTTPFRYYLRVRYQDCDAQHVVFNSRYSDYADITSIEFMRAALPRPTDGFDGTFEIQSVRQVIEWKSSARFDYVLEISAWVSRIGTTSLTLD